MRLFVGLGLGWMVACSGDGSDDAPTEATCDGLRTAPIGTIPVEEWPKGLVAVKDDVENLTGFYTADNSCTGEKTTVGITSVTQEEIAIVTTPYPTGSPCGCTEDVDYAPDANLAMTTQITSFSLVVDNFGDPFVDDHSFQTTGATYEPSEPFLFRACDTDPIDPEAGSKYSSVEMVFRLDANRSLEARFVLDPIDGSDLVTCELTDFETLN